MGDIFKNAECVLSCMGTLTKSLEDIVDPIQEAAARYESQLNESNAKHNALCAWFKDVELWRVERLVEAFHEFGNVEYWSRLWVIQEIMLQPKIHILCGARDINFEYVYLLDRILDITETSASKEKVVLAKGIQASALRSARENNALFTILDYITARDGDVTPSISLNCFLKNRHPKKCFDTRDRIYGSLNIVKWPEDGPLEPDYSLSPQELAVEVLYRFQNYQEACIDIKLLLEALGLDYEGVAHRSTRDLPHAWTATAQIVSIRSAHTYWLCECGQPRHVCMAMWFECHQFATLCVQMSHMFHDDSVRAGHHVHLEIGASNLSAALEGNFGHAGWYLTEPDRPSFRVQAGDCFVDIAAMNRFGEKAEDEKSQVFRSDLIIRKTDSDLFEIISQTNLSGQSLWRITTTNRPCPRGQIGKRFVPLARSQECPPGLRQQDDYIVDPKQFYHVNRRMCRCLERFSENMSRKFRRRFSSGAIVEAEPYMARFYKN